MRENLCSWSKIYFFELLSLVDEEEDFFVVLDVSFFVSRDDDEPDFAVDDLAFDDDDEGLRDAGDLDLDLERRRDDDDFLLLLLRGERERERRLDRE